MGEGSLFDLSVVIQINFRARLRLRWPKAVEAGVSSNPRDISNPICNTLRNVADTESIGQYRAGGVLFGFFYRGQPQSD